MLSDNSAEEQVTCARLSVHHLFKLQISIDFRAIRYEHHDEDGYPTLGNSYSLSSALAMCEVRKTLKPFNIESYYWV